MDKNITVSGFAKYRLERAKQDLSDAEFSYKHKRYLNANNRAYYAIFHAIKAVLALARELIKLVDKYLKEYNAKK